MTEAFECFGSFYFQANFDKKPPTTGILIKSAFFMLPVMSRKNVNSRITTVTESKSRIPIGCEESGN